MRPAAYAGGVAVVGDEAVCVRHWDWSETSQTVWVYARAHGLIRAVAKGSKRADARFSGGVELLTRAEAQFSLRRVQRSGQGLATLASWDLIETFPGAKSSVGSFYAGMVLLDLVQHSVQELDPHPGLYDELVPALRSLGGGGDDAVLLRFTWAALREAGQAPALGVDIVSGAPLAAAKTYAFLPRRGGFSADAGADHGTDGPMWRTRAETYATLDALASGEAVALEPASIQRAARLLLSFFRETFACDPNAVRAWLARAPED